MDTVKPVPTAGVEPVGVPLVEGKPVGRRVFLGMLGAGAAGILWGAKASDGLSKMLRPLTEHDSTGLTSLLPTAGRFRFYSVVGFSPHRTDTDYRLNVTGLVKNPTTLTLADLQAMPSTRLVKDFQCVTGWRVPQVPWTGVKLADVLDHVGVEPSAKAVLFTSFDGTYSESLTLDQARRDDVMVAYAMEDHPISAAHGGPVRLYVAPMYGYKSCKWLDTIQLAPKVEPGYWEQGGYDVDGWIGKSNGRSDQPV
jgi:DMSO/TMAO reductase YedYZ molybdopterin-dependent catalytic subunit